jgi:hypothetical protein
MAVKTRKALIQEIEDLIVKFETADALTKATNLAAAIAAIELIPRVKELLRQVKPKERP